MSFKPEFKVINDPKWYDNALRFATEAEAEENASQKFQAWLMADEYRVAESDDPVNYAMVDGKLQRIG